MRGCAVRLSQPVYLLPENEHVLLRLITGKNAYPLNPPPCQTLGIVLILVV